jgi:prepilin signal peptidase PulO-like enzyme (type II secretory pathway)
MQVLFSPPGIIGITSVWAIIAYFLARENERCFGEEAKASPPPILFWAVLLLCVVFEAYNLPIPLSLSAAIATGGLGVAAWSDSKTGYLWDDIILCTQLFSALSMLIGGMGLVSIEGGIGLGFVSLMLYFVPKIFKRETGFGDVKHITAIGFAIGLIPGVLAIFIATFLSLLEVVSLAIKNKQPFSQFRGVPLPWGPALTAGMVISVGISTHLHLPNLDEFFSVIR